MMRSLLGTYSVGSTLFKMSNLFKMSINPLNDVIYRFRGDSRDAALIFNEGFTPKGNGTSLKSHLSTSEHSFYVSMTYSIAQALKYGDDFLETTVYAAQPPIITNVQLSRFPKLSQYHFISNHRNLYATFENEIAACGGVAPDKIYAAQKIYGTGLFHVLKPIQYNKNFRPNTYEVMIPSADDTEAKEIESYFLTTDMFPELHHGEKFITLKEAQQMSQALSSYDASEFKVENTFNIERQVIRTVPADKSQDQMVTLVLAKHHEYMTEHYNRKKKLHFFSHNSQNKTEILKNLPTDGTTLKK